MAFEKFQEQLEAESQKKQREENERQQLINKAKLEQEEKRRKNIEAAAEKRSLSELRHQQALIFRQQSGLSEKLAQFRKLIKGSSSLSEDVSEEYKTDMHSVVDRLSWDKTITSTRRLPMRSEGGYDITEVQSFYLERYLIAETLPDGIIRIRGVGPYKIFSWILIEGADVSIPESVWRDNPEIFEEPIVSAYKVPLTRNDSEKKESGRMSTPYRWESG